MKCSHRTITTQESACGVGTGGIYKISDHHGLFTHQNCVSSPYGIEATHVHHNDVIGALGDVTTADMNPTAGIGGDGGWHILYTTKVHDVINDTTTVTIQPGPIAGAHDTDVPGHATVVEECIPHRIPCLHFKRT